MNSVANIIRSVNRTKPYNIITFPTHERYETNLCHTGHRFVSLRGQGIKDWNDKYAKRPSNYTLCRRSEDQTVESYLQCLPADIECDLILSQQKFGQAQVAMPLSQILGVPLVMLEHTWPLTEWPKSRLAQLKQMRGDVNLFISSQSRAAWGWSDTEASVVTHGIDSDLFSPCESIPRELKILSVVNDWVNRDYACGFSIWREVTSGLPVRPLGDTPGLSVAPSCVEQLIYEYRSNAIFVNTSIQSPVPMSLLEAMSCGMAVVSTDNCMLADVIEDGVNGFRTNDKSLMRKRLVDLLNDEGMRIELGRKARTTILTKFSLQNFVSSWNKVFDNVLNR